MPWKRWKKFIINIQASPKPLLVELIIRGRTHVMDTNIDYITIPNIIIDITMDGFHPFFIYNGQRSPTTNL